jgi:hypothetical protein
MPQGACTFNLGPFWWKIAIITILAFGGGEGFDIPNFNEHTPIYQILSAGGPKGLTQAIVVHVVAGGAKGALLSASAGALCGVSISIRW